MPKLPKLPKLKDLTSGYKSFIDEQGGKVRDFMNGLLGQGGDKVITDRISEDETSSGAETGDFGPIISARHKELSQLEHIKILLKEARDQPLL